MGGARPHAEREDGLQAYPRICSAARKTAAPIRLQYSNGHLVKHVTRYVTHEARYVTPLMLMLFMTSNSDYIMLYGTNPGLGLQPVLSPREDGRRPSRRGSGLSSINDLFKWNVMTQSFYRSNTRMRTFYIVDTAITKLSP